MNVAFRVDATASMGIGHVKRCLSLARALVAAGMRTIFITRKGSYGAAEFITAEGVECCLLPAVPTAGGFDLGVAAEDDARDTAAILAGVENLDWVVTDHYGIDAHWHQAFRRQRSTRIACIDDLGNRPHAADLLIDHNFVADHRAKYQGLFPKDKLLLGGPRYALLGPAYAEAPKYKPHPQVRSVGVFMGGTDPGGASARCVKVLLDEVGFTGQVAIATTSANPHLEALREFCRCMPRTSLLVDLPDLAGFFAAHDLQVGAGGGAMWERCCMGVPTLAVALADNQLEVLPALSQAGVVRWLPDLDQEALRDAMQSLITDASGRASLAQAGKRLVDGRGATRVALAMTASKGLTLRPARAEDAQRLWAWRNDPGIRANSRSSELIPLVDHERWQAAVMADPHRRLLLACVGDTPVGSIRYDRIDEACFEVSIYLDPDLLGLGLGSALLAAGERWLVQSCSARLIRAEVLPHNTASIRLFRAAGYTGEDHVLHKALPGGVSASTFSLDRPTFQSI